MKTISKRKRGADISKRPSKTGTYVAAKASGSLVRQLRSILVPIDFSPDSTEALRYAAMLAGQMEAKMILLHVVQPMIGPDFVYFPRVMESNKAMASSERELERIPASQGVDSSLIDRCVVRYGVPFQEITAAAKSLKVDLIVISTRGYTGLTHVLLGSTAERVVRHADCPVLVVRAQKGKKR
jgi:universal stress protein A